MLNLETFILGELVLRMSLQGKGINSFFIKQLWLSRDQIIHLCVSSSSWYLFSIFFWKAQFSEINYTSSVMLLIGNCLLHILQCKTFNHKADSLSLWSPFKFCLVFHAYSCRDRFWCANNTDGRHQGLCWKQLLYFTEKIHSLTSTVNISHSGNYLITGTQTEVIMHWWQNCSFSESRNLTSLFIFAF